MDSATFKRNVSRTVAVRSAKAGIKNVARDTKSTNVLYGIFGLNTEVGGLMQGLQPYLLGFQLREDMIQSTFTSLGGVSYFVMVLAQNLKIKVPGSKKKVKLAVTKTEALLKLNALAVDLLYAGMAAFTGGDLHKESITALVDEIIALLWPLTYDMVGVTPADVFTNYSDRLAAGYPEGLFSKDIETYRAAAKVMKDRETEDLAELAASRKKVKDPAVAQEEVAA